jgi:hypothetical protein
VSESPEKVFPRNALLMAAPIGCFSSFTPITPAMLN